MAPAEIVPGGTAPVAIVVSVPPGWHIYWENPGQSGLPTDVRLQAQGDLASAKGDRPRPGTPSVAAGPRFPTPIRFAADGLVNYGYEGDTAFLFDVSAPGNAPVTLDAAVSWLLCRDICVAGSGVAHATIAVLAAARAPDRSSDPVAPYVARLPAAFATSGGTVTRADGTLRLTLPGPGPFDLFPSIPLEGAWAPVVTTAADGSLLVESPLPAAPDGARLVLTRGAGASRQGYVLDLTEPRP